MADDSGGSPPSKKQRLSRGKVKNAKRTQSKLKRDPEDDAISALNGVEGSRTSDFDSHGDAEQELDTSDDNQQGVDDDQQGALDNQQGLNKLLPPLDDIRAMFAEITKKAKNFSTILRSFPEKLPHQVADNNSKSDLGLEACATYLQRLPINVATFCSGTESPIIALQMIIEALTESDPNLEMNINHLFSAEIVPFKQHYIETNFSPPIIFADITELGNELRKGQTERTLTTAYGGKAAVPGNVDLFIAGFSCVDFSPLNGHKKDLKDNGESGDTFFAMRKYAKEYRPKVIILENVRGAPWTRSSEAEERVEADVEKTTKAKVKKPTKNRATIDYFMGKIGYATKFIVLDTKHYFLPQTRVRGYMICVDMSLYSSRGLDAAKDFAMWEADPFFTKSENWTHIDMVNLNRDLDMWKQVVEGLKRPASVPFDQLLYRSDAPALEALTTQSNQVSQVKRQTSPWERCKMNHHEYRLKEKIGHKREMTEWVNGGAYIPEDFWMRNQKGLVERVLDTIDIAHLRSLSRGFDDRYQSRPLELSQNVYRVEDKTKPGIVGCLTPTGIPFLTSRGSRIIGLEAIALQGLGIEELDLAMLSQGNLQDLAGNAMTSTVVGAALAAAIGIFYPKLGLQGRTPKQQPAAILPGLPKEELLVEKMRCSTAYSHKLAAKEAMKQARYTRRMCACEGQLHVKQTDFQECTTCAHITCKQCGIKPKHHYVKIPQSDILARKDPSTFAKLIKNSIPPNVCFKSNTKVSDELMKQVTGKKMEAIQFQKIVTSALTSNVYLRDIRRDEFWEINYDSPTAKLVLTISQNKVQWQLFANVPTAGLDSAIGKYFRRFPIATMAPCGDDINVGSWRFWIPEKRTFKTKLRWSGKPIKSFAAQRGLLSKTGDHVYPSCELQIQDYDARYFERDVQGCYTLSQECAQPHNTLHALQRKGSENLLFFYLEQHLRTGSGDPKDQDHWFVFTEDTHRLEKLEQRQTIANFVKTWRPPLIKVKELQIDRDMSEDDNERYVQIVEKLEHANVTYDHCGAAIFADGYWVPFVDFSMSSGSGTDLKFQVLPADLESHTLSSYSCESPSLAVLTFEAALPDKISGSWKKGIWNLISRGNESRFVKEFGWALSHGSIIAGHTEADSAWHFIDAHVVSCLRCSPERPQLLWSRNAKGKVVPCVEPRAATEYERMLKLRPQGLSAKYLISNDSKVMFKIGGNPMTLVHRATSLLRSANPDIAAHSRIMTSWRLITDDQTNPNTQQKILTVIERMLYRPQVEVPGFVKKYSLKPAQNAALAWALERDKGQQSFTEVEVVEARLDKLGIRLEGRASRQVHRRGGLLFFDVGFGKTPITLALASCCLRDDNAAVKRLAKEKPPSEIGKFHSKATLILVPGHLHYQWESEISKFMGISKNAANKGTKSAKNNAKDRVLIIDTIKSLRKKTIQDFLDADLIIFNWRILSSDAYIDDLAHFAGIVERDTTSTRTKGMWYEKATLGCAQTVKDLHDPDLTPRIVWERVHARYAEDREKSDTTDAHVPTKRTRGKNYIPVEQRDAVIGGKRKRKREDEVEAPPNGEGTQAREASEPVKSKKRAPRKKPAAPEKVVKTQSAGNTASNGKAMSSKQVKKPEKPRKAESVLFPRERSDKSFNFSGANDVNGVNCPLLEIFVFSRLVVDELTYLLDDPVAVIMLKKISAASRFALSGTPNVTSFQKVKALAGMLDIHLGIDDYASLRGDEFSQVTKDLSKTEIFLAYKSIASTGWHNHRQDVAQAFLDTFARKDRVNLSKLPCTMHYLLVDLHPAQKAVYLELQQRVASSTFENFRGRNENSDIEKQIRDAICKDNDPKKALLLRASCIGLETAQEQPKATVQNHAATEVQDSSEPQVLDLSATSAHEPVDNETDDDEIGSDEPDDNASDVHATATKAVPKPVSISVADIIRSRSQEYDELKGELAKLLTQAVWLSKQDDCKGCHTFSEWVQRMKADQLHDPRCKTDVVGLIEHAQSSSHTSDWMKFYIKVNEGPERQKVAIEKGLQPFPEGANQNSNITHLSKMVTHLRTTTMLISRLTEVTSDHYRSLRFMRAIGNVQVGTSICSSCEHFIANPANGTILGGCGHTVCTPCLIRSRETCCVTGCNLDIKVFQKVAGTEICGLYSDAAISHTSKADAIIDLITSKPEEDKFLLFVQDSRFTEQLMAAMKDSSIEFLNMTNPVTSATVLAEFQSQNKKKNKGKRTGKGKVEEREEARVLVLDPTGESASGANLTCANHVIFASPIYTTGFDAQHKYESTTTQAIGRARRYGQEKHVHVYTFMSVNTIDVDLFQHRQGKIVERAPFNHSIARLIDGDIATSSTLHSAIKHLNFPTEPMTD